MARSLNVGDSGYVKVPVQEQGEALRWLWFCGRVVDVKDNAVVTLVAVGSERPGWVGEAAAAVEMVLQGANMVLVAVSGQASDIHKKPTDNTPVASQEAPPRREALQGYYTSIMGAEAHFLTASEAEDKEESAKVKALESRMRSFEAVQREMAENIAKLVSGNRSRRTTRSASEEGSESSGRKEKLEIQGMPDFFASLKKSKERLGGTPSGKRSSSLGKRFKLLAEEDETEKKEKANPMAEVEKLAKSTGMSTKEVFQLNLMKEFMEAKGKKRGTSSSSSASEMEVVDDNDEKKIGIAKVISSYHRSKKEITKHPKRFVKGFVKESIETLTGEEDSDKPVNLIDLQDKVVYPNKTLQRCLVQDLYVIKLLLANKPMEATAQAMANYKSKRQACMDQGNWGNAWPLCYLPHPRGLHPNQFAGTERELEVITSYNEAMTKLQKKTQQTPTRQYTAEEWKEWKKNKDKGKGKGKDKQGEKEE